jgi:hypothetical protein
MKYEEWIGVTPLWDDATLRKPDQLNNKEYWHSSEKQPKSTFIGCDIIN